MYFKRCIFLLMLVMTLTIPAAAQKHHGKNRNEMRKEMREFHLKFLAQEVELKDDRQKNFFDTYSQMMDEREKIFKETRDLERKLKDGKASEDEYEAVTNAITAAKEKDAAIEKKYDDKFSKFLTPKQLYQLKEAENKWRAKMQEMRHSHRKNRR